MSNAFLSVAEIAKESLLRLRNNLVMRELVYSDHSGEYAQKGDTVNVRMPATFQAEDFSSSISEQAVKEGAVPVKLDRIADVSVDITSKELTLNVQDFGFQVAEGAMQALAQKIDADLLELYADIPYVAGGATPGNLPNALADIAGARQVLNEQGAPFGNRSAVWNPATEANLIILDAIVGADKSGSTAALREAAVGRVLGFENYMGQNVHTHTKGTLAIQDGKTEILPDGAHTVGATTLKLKQVENGGKAVKGDLIDIAGKGRFVVTAESAAAASNKVELSVYPALPVLAGTEAVTLVDSHVANLAFHRNAFAFVNRPMALPLGGAAGAVETFEGISLRVTMGYAMLSKKNTISFDVLYGCKTLQPELACRVWRQ